MADNFLLSFFLCPLFHCWMWTSWTVPLNFWFFFSPIFYFCPFAFQKISLSPKVSNKFFLSTIMFLFSSIFFPALWVLLNSILLRFHQCNIFSYFSKCIMRVLPTSPSLLPQSLFLPGFPFLFVLTFRFHIGGFLQISDIICYLDIFKSTETRKFIRNFRHMGGAYHLWATP